MFAGMATKRRRSRRVRVEFLLVVSLFALVFVTACESSPLVPEGAEMLKPDAGKSPEAGGLPPPPGAGAAGGAASASDTSWVARVNGDTIAMDEYNQVVRMQLQQFAMAAGGQVPPQVSDMVRRETLDRLIERELLFQAAEQAGIKPDQQKVQEMLGRIEQQAQMSGGLDAMLAAQGMTRERLLRDIGRNDQLHTYLDKLTESVQLPETEVKAYYDSHPARFKKSEEVQASHILLRLDPNAPPEQVKATETKLNDLKQQALKGDFNAVAAENSEDPSAKMNNGRLGSFGHGKMVPEFEKAAFAAKVGEIVGPVRTQFGMHLIKVTGRTPEHTQSFEEVKAKLAEELTNERKDKAVEEKAKALRAAAKIETNLDLPKPSETAGLPPGMGPPPAGGDASGGELKLTPPAPIGGGGDGVGDNGGEGGLKLRPPGSP